MNCGMKSVPHYPPPYLSITHIYMYIYIFIDPAVLKCVEEVDLRSRFTSGAKRLKIDSHTHISIKLPIISNFAPSEDTHLLNPFLS